VLELTPKTNSGMNRVLKREIYILKNKADRLSEENSYLREQLSKEGVPDNIRAMMAEYGVCWECFWCYDHSEWFIEMDSLFPYHHEDNTCSKCN